MKISLSSISIIGYSVGLYTLLLSLSLPIFVNEYRFIYTLPNLAGSVQQTNHSMLGRPVHLPVRFSVDNYQMLGRIFNQAHNAIP